MRYLKIVCFVLFINTFFIQQEVSGQIESQNKFCNLKLEVEAFKKQYFPLEPIQFSYKIFNPTDSSIEISRAYVDFTFHLEVRKDNKTISPQLSNIRGRTENILIQPNQKIEGKEFLNFKLSNIFPDYGKYELVFTIYGRESDKELRGKISSNKVEIIIEKPTGLNAQALDFIYKTHPNPLIYGVFRGWDDKRENKTKTPAEEFVEKYSGSVYGNYAILALAYQYKYEKKYELAKRELNKLKNKENFAYSKEVIRELEEIEQTMLKIELKEKEN